MSRGSFVQLLFFPGVITLRGSNVHNIVIVIQGFRYPWVLTSRGFYIQRFLCPGVLLSNYYYVGGLLHSGVLTYITLLLSSRGLEILGFLHPRVLTFRDSYAQRF